ncbi:unnamed protein product [Pieris brassicae]|uniref:Uncharacterized protein n=1 Tax=Pieris brassicae TaxID=7116 RepID=A0A9P0T0J1_PIEBR|nr:unnamed protein product [Pieris brassicae]
MKVTSFASVSVYASMQASSVRRRCCTPAPPVATPSPLRSRLLARLALPLACLTSRPAALRDAPRYSHSKLFATLQKLSVQYKIPFYIPGYNNFENREFL